MIDPSNLALMGLSGEPDRFGQALELCRTLTDSLEEERQRTTTLIELADRQQELITALQAEHDTKAQKIHQYLKQAVLTWRKRVAESTPDSEDHLVARCYVDAFQSVHTALFGSLIPLSDDHA